MLTLDEMHTMMHAGTASSRWDRKLFLLCGKKWIGNIGRPNNNRAIFQVSVLQTTGSLQGHQNKSIVRIFRQKFPSSNVEPFFESIDRCVMGTFCYMEIMCFG
jgi:hypothetical protein